MATGAVIGALRVVLGADTAALEKGLAKSTSLLDQFGKVAKFSLAAVGVASTLEGINHAIRGTIDQFDEIGKSAQKVGIPTEELSKLKFAADLSDVSFESLSKSIAKFDVQVLKAAGGVDNDFSRALAAMGVTITDANGNLKSQTQLLGDIADKFAGYEDGVAKTGLAINLFNKRGAELIPLLNQGSKGLADAGLEAEKFGLVISGTAAAAAEKFNDNMKRLSAQTTGAWNAITTAILPSLVNISEAFVSTSKSADAFSVIGTALAQVMKALATAVLSATASFSTLTDIIRVPFDVLKEAVQGNFGAAGEAVSGFADRTKERFNDLVKSVEQVWRGFTPPTFTLEAIAQAFKGKVEAPVVESAEKSKNAWETFIQSTQKSIVAQQAQIATFGQLAGAIEATRLQMLGLNAAQEAGITKITPAMQAQLDALAAKAAGAANQLQGLQLKQEVQTSWETYNTTLERNQQLLAQGAISVETFGKANERAAQTAGLTWQQQSASLAGSFAEIATAFGKENADMVKAAQILGATQALISTFVAQAEALKLPFPLNIAAVAAIAAKGFALVASIKSTSVPKFAQGGSFKVPGGTAANDNMLMPLALASGERVDVTPAGGGGGQGATINIDLRGDQGFYSRATVERLINAIHTVTADGHSAQIVVIK